MLPFSALSKTEAPATSRRMSRPEAGLAMTPTVTGNARRPLLFLVVEELPDQAVHLPRGLHLRHVPSLFENLDAGVFGQVLGVDDRDYVVFAAPNHEDRDRKLGEVWHVGLLPIREDLVGDLPKRFVYPVETLEPHDVLDQLARDEVGVCEEHP